jgi:hypothetical protein
MQQPSAPVPRRGNKQAERDARLARALRDNLRRRKAQARVRQPAPDPAPPDGVPGDGAADLSAAGLSPKSNPDG